MHSNFRQASYLISMGYSDFRWEEIIMAWGLNRAQREIVRGLITEGVSGPEVRRHIHDMSREEGWDYNKNVNFCRELATDGYPETAKYLERLINS